MRDRLHAGWLPALLLGAATTAAAASDDGPLSAIPWLSDTLETQVERYEPPATPLEEEPPIDVAPLESPELGATGLIAPDTVG